MHVAPAHGPMCSVFMFDLLVFAERLKAMNPHSIYCWQLLSVIRLLRRANGTGGCEHFRKSFQYDRNVCAPLCRVCYLPEWWTACPHINRTETIHAKSCVIPGHELVADRLKRYPGIWAKPTISGKSARPSPKPTSRKSRISQSRRQRLARIESAWQMCAVPVAIPNNFKIIIILIIISSDRAHNLCAADHRLPNKPVADTTHFTLWREAWTRNAHARTRLLSMHRMLVPTQNPNIEITHCKYSVHNDQTADWQQWNAAASRARETACALRM